MHRGAPPVYPLYITSRGPRYPLYLPSMVGTGGDWWGLVGSHLSGAPGPGAGVILGGIPRATPGGIPGNTPGGTATSIPRATPLPTGTTPLWDATSFWSTSLLRTLLPAGAPWLKACSACIGGLAFCDPSDAYHACSWVQDPVRKINGLPGDP